jgi:hypothetical protein
MMSPIVTAHLANVRLVILRVEKLQPHRYARRTSPHERRPMANPQYQPEVLHTIIAGELLSCALKPPFYCLRLSPELASE